VPARFDDIDPPERISRVEPDLLVLLEPGIHGCEVQLDETGRVAVDVPAADASAVGLVANAVVVAERVGSGVVVDGEPGPGDIAEGHHVLRMPTNGVHQLGSGRVGDRLGAEAGADPPWCGVESNLVHGGTPVPG
jgi:hypothetical protein